MQIPQGFYAYEGTDGSVIMIDKKSAGLRSRATIIVVGHQQLAEGSSFDDHCQASLSRISSAVDNFTVTGKQTFPDIPDFKLITATYEDGGQLYKYQTMIGMLEGVAVYTEISATPDNYNRLDPDNLLMAILSSIEFNAAEPDTTRGGEQSALVPFTAPDGSFSLYIPTGWRAVVTEGALYAAEDMNTPFSPGLKIIPLQYETNVTSMQVAELLLQEAAGSTPDFTVIDTQQLQEGTDLTAVLYSFSQEGTKLYGMSYLVAMGQQAIWADFYAPEEKFTEYNAPALLAVVLQSMAGGSQPNQVSMPAATPVESPTAETSSTSDAGESMVNNQMMMDSMASSYSSMQAGMDAFSGWDAGSGGYYDWTGGYGY